MYAKQQDKTLIALNINLLTPSRLFKTNTLASAITPQNGAPRNRSVVTKDLLMETIYTKIRFLYLVVLLCNLTGECKEY